MNHKNMKQVGGMFVGMVLVLVLAACSSESVPVEGVLRSQDFGTAGVDSASGVAALPGGAGAVVVGGTNGSLDGANKGSYDAFIRKYDGGVVWANQFGTRNFDAAFAVAVTSTGISYVVGETGGALGFKVGFRDVFLRKYDANGVVQWTRQFGTTGDDYAKDVTLDNSGNVYVLSIDNGTAFRVRKYNASGTLLLTITNTTAGVSFPPALAVDSTGNIFVLTNYLSGTRYYARLFKYNSAGTLVVSPNVFGSLSRVTTYDLVVDSSNNLYVSLYDVGTNRGGYIRKVNNSGTSLWTQRIEPSTGAVSSPRSLALDTSNNVYVTGATRGAYPTYTLAGFNDIFVLKLAAATGARLWTRQFGGNGSEEGYGIVVSDAVYVAGYSNSTPNLLGDTSYGDFDAFLAQLDPATGAVLGIDQ
jgi:hypothetical protein